MCVKFHNQTEKSDLVQGHQGNYASGARERFSSWGGKIFRDDKEREIYYLIYPSPWLHESSDPMAKWHHEPRMYVHYIMLLSPVPVHIILERRESLRSHYDFYISAYFTI